MPRSSNGYSVNVFFGASANVNAETHPDRATACRRARARRDLAASLHPDVITRVTVTRGDATIYEVRYTPRASRSRPPRTPTADASVVAPLRAVAVDATMATPTVGPHLQAALNEISRDIAQIDARRGRTPRPRGAAARNERQTRLRVATPQPLTADEAADLNVLDADG